MTASKPNKSKHYKSNTNNQHEVESQRLIKFIRDTSQEHTLDI